MPKGIYAVGNQVEVKLGEEVFPVTITENKFGRLKVELESGEIISCHVSEVVGYERVDAGVPGAGFDLPEAYAKPLSEMREGTSSHVIDQEWAGQIERGDPFGETAKPYQDANPDKHFRFLGDFTVKRRGRRDYQTVYDGNQKPVKVNGMELAWVPKHIHEQRAERMREDGRAKQEAQKQAAEENIERAAADSHGAITVLSRPNTDYRIRN